MNRIVITSCSRQKKRDAGPIPAIERYDGPSFRLLRKYLRTSTEDVDIFVLSARYGLVSQNAIVPYYDYKLSEDRVKELSVLASVQAQKLFSERTRCREVLINLGRIYFSAFEPTIERLLSGNSLKFTSGPSGRRLSELYNWLYGEKPGLEEHTKKPRVPKEVEFKGVLVKACEEDLRILVRNGLENGEEQLIANYQSWFVCIDERKISPKWLIHKLSGIPVGKFHSDQARSILRKLGIEVRRI